MKSVTSSELLKLAFQFDIGTHEPYQLVTKVLADLVSLGFHSSRFYLLVENGGDAGSSVFQLASSCYADEKLNPPAGYRIKFSDTMIFRKNSIAQGYSVGRADELPDVIWSQDLFIQQCNSLDLLILNPLTNEINGLLAISWKGSPELLDEESLSSLRLLSYRIATWMTSQSARVHQQLASLEQTLVLDQFGDPSAVSLSSISTFFSEAFSANLLACFKYKWNSGLLEKIEEALNGNLNETLDYPEIYPVGVHLTGKAFIEKAYRFIPDFQSFLTNSNNLVFQPSLQRHREKLGEISSCMYCTVFFGRHSYLFRLFRSVNSSHGIYSKRDRDDLVISADRLSLALERKVRQFQQMRLRTAATDSFSKMLASRSVAVNEFAELTDYLVGSGTENFLISVRGENEADAEAIFANGDFSLLAQSPTWKQTCVHASIVRNKDIASISIIELAGHGAQKNLRAEIRKELENPRVTELLLLSIHSPKAVTTLVMSREDESKGVSHGDNVVIDKNEEAFIGSLLSICSSARVAQELLISSDLADQILADIGHEVGTPVSILSQTAILACDDAIDAVRQLSRILKGLNTTIIESDADNVNQLINGLKLTRRELQNRRTEVDEVGGLLQIVTEVPRVLALLGSSSLELDVQEYDCADLLSDVWHDALMWSAVLDEGAFSTGRMSRGYFRVEYSGDVSKLSLMCDRSTIRMALGNVIKNAMKYSHPRFLGMPMVINVHVSANASRTGIRVSNWGSGIPKDKMRSIFRKYERFELNDRKRIIRGRGIGLYLAKTFFMANDGDIECLDSKPTLDDTERTIQKLEGYETTFNMWIPATTRLGRRRVKL